MRFYKIILFSLFCLLLSSCGESANSGAAKSSTAPEPKKNIDISMEALASVADPVCGMPMHKGEIADTAIYEDKIYAFCGAGCKTEFQKSPAQYLTQK